MSENQGYPYYYYPQASPAFYPAYDYRQEPQPPQNMQNMQDMQGTQGMPGMPGMQNMQGMQAELPTEQSYIENILRLNLGKKATVYMTFENNTEWNAKVFKGIVEAAGRDHIIISEPKTNKRYLLLMIYLDYITFEGELNYDYPYGGS